MSNTVTSKKKYDTGNVSNQVKVEKSVVGWSKRFEVNWDSGAKVTSMGSLVYFSQYLHSGPDYKYAVFRINK
jgi:hypothetical protein